MQIHRLSPKHGLAILTPEEPEDLWTLRRILEPGDLLAAETTRVVKQRGEFMRPDKGERLRVLLTLQIEEISFDSTLGRLRVAGRILEASEEMLPKGSHHSLSVEMDHKLSLRKDHLTAGHVRLIRRSEGEASRLIVVAVDMREAGIGVVRGTHLQLYPTIDSGLRGKQYGAQKADLGVFLSKIAEFLEQISREGDMVIISGPGPVKSMLQKSLGGHPRLSKNLQMIEGIDLAGEDGILMTLRSDGLRAVASRTRIARASMVLEEGMRRIARNDTRVAFGLKESQLAAARGAVESTVISEAVFGMLPSEQELVGFLNSVESRRGECFLVDSSSDLGARTSGLGGVVSILRFPVADSKA